jgi:hypothetical protein
MLVSRVEEKDIVDMDHVKWILIVEKEVHYRSFLLETILISKGDIPLSS